MVIMVTVIQVIHLMEKVTVKSLFRETEKYLDKELNNFQKGVGL